jgi:hypothetical protein
MTDLLDSMPGHAMTNHELIHYAKKLKLNHLRGVFMRDELPPFPLSLEYGILNYDDSSRSGSHWSAYLLNTPRKLCVFYNSYGSLEPPVEFYVYVKKFQNVFINMSRDQYHYGHSPSEICGQLSLRFLYTNKNLLE